MSKVGDAELEVHPVPVAGFRNKLESQVNGDMTKAGKAGGSAYAKGWGGGVKKLAGLAGGYLAVSKLTGFLKESNAEARESQKVGAQTVAVLKSTSSASGLTAAGFGNLATAISLKTGIDDEQIQAGENMLATFTNVQNRLGKGNKIFSQATKLSTDLAVATKTGPVAANLLLGKALNDPIKGIGRLTKIGVTFTDQQKKQVEQMVKVGDTAGAQKVILKELAKEFGGSAAAQATAGDKASVAIGNLKEQIGTALLPQVDRLANFTTNRAVPAITEFITGIQDGTGAGGEFADTIKSEILPVAKNLAREAKLVGGALLPVLHIVAALPPGLVATGGAVGFLSKGLARIGPQLPATATGFERIGAGIRNLAGAGGLLAVADSANRTSPALGALEGAAGGAAAGFAIGGPWGAGIGAIAGGLLGLKSSGSKAAAGIAASEEASRNAVAPLDSLSESIDGVTGAYTKMDKAAISSAVRNQPGVIKASNALGLNIRTVVNAALGVPAATRKVDAAYAKSREAAALYASELRKNPFAKAPPGLVELADAALTVDAALGRVNEKTKRERIEALQAELATGRLGKALKNVPDQTVVRIATEGKTKALADIRSVAGSTNLSRNQVRLLLKVAGLPQTKKAINSVISSANKLKLGPGVDPKKTNGGIAALIRGAKKAVKDSPPAVTPKVNGDPAHAQMIQFLNGLQSTANNNSPVVRPRIGSPLGVGGRVTGGPVMPGRSYVVGEHRPEVFEPREAGRIVPRVSAASAPAPAAASSGFSGPVTLMVGEMEFEAYMTAVAQDAVA